MVRFDTLNKKPKVWSILILSAAVLLLLVMLRGIFHVSYMTAGILVCLYIAAVIGILVRAFVRQLRYNPYSYNTIYYAGFALISLTAQASQIMLLVRLGRGEITDDAVGFLNMMSQLQGSARSFMILSAPFILFFSAALCISNLSLIRHEGRRLVNILGIILAVLLIGGELFLFFGDFYTSGSELEVMRHDLFINFFASVYLYFECMLIGTIIANVIVVSYEPDPDRDFVIILGCGIRKDGTPTPLLKGRCDRALRFYKKQLRKTGKAPILIPSGGQGPDEAVSESEAMTNYLLEKGVPAEHILIEDRSKSTRENMRFSKEIIQKVNPQGKIAYATTNYHVFRSGLMARRVKMRAVGMGARTKWYFWPNAAVREFVGILTEHRLKQALILGGMILFYAVTTVLCYRAF